MEIVLKIVLFALSISEMYMCYRFVFLCWADKKNLTKVKKVIFAVIICVVGVMVGINRSFFFFSQWVFIMQVGIVSLFALTLPTKGKLISIEVVCTYFVLVALVDFLFAFFAGEILEDSFVERVFVGVRPIKVVIMLTTRVFLYFIFTRLEKKKETIKETVYEYRKSLAIFCVCSLAILRGYQIVLAEYVDSGGRVRVLSAAFSLLIIFILAFLEIGMIFKNAEVTRKLDYITLKNDMQDEYYQQLSALMGESREHIHDMKHHIQILDKYAEEGEYERIHNYLREIGLPVLSLGRMVWTGSEILDLVLNQKKIDAEKNNVRMKIDVKGECCLPLTDREICSLFSNLLDNALEACIRMESEERWIEVQLDEKGEMISIDVRNSIGESPQIIGGKFQSKKKDKNLHGLGLHSVERIMDKQGGFLEAQVEEGCFDIHIILFKQ